MRLQDGRRVGDFTRINEPTKHVDVCVAPFSDAGSIPAASTMLRSASLFCKFLSYVWQAISNNMIMFSGRNMVPSVALAKEGY